MPAIPVEGTAKVIIGGVDWSETEPLRILRTYTVPNVPTILLAPSVVARNMKAVAARTMTRGLRARQRTIRRR